MVSGFLCLAWIWTSLVSGFLSLLGSSRLLCLICLCELGIVGVPVCDACISRSWTTHRLFALPLPRFHSLYSAGVCGIHVFMHFADDGPDGGGCVCFVAAATDTRFAGPR